MDLEFKNLDLNKDFRKALNLMENTSKNIFITGKAGCGKSTLLSLYIAKTKKNVVILAPTGVAALNISGQTIHSFFKFKPDITLDKVHKIKDNKIYKKIDTIIIDEISMVRADLIDCMDRFLRLNGRDKNKKFGGLQMILIGDLYQLEPIIKDEEKAYFYNFYQTPYFFSSKAFSDFNFEYIELNKIYRQKDKEFIDILNAIRVNNIDNKKLDFLNKNIDNIAGINNFNIYLTTTNKLADKINSQKLRELRSSLYKSDGYISGEFDKQNLPNSIQLYYKEGAQVIMLNNDRLSRWVNGSVGIIKKIKEISRLENMIIIQLENGKDVEVEKYTWDLYKYEYNKDKDIIESVLVGSFTQYPFKLAWAITIHKSQGKTFNNIILDLGSGAFASGQVYVALSRCTRLKGITLKQRINKSDIILNSRINNFFRSLNSEQ